LIINDLQHGTNPAAQLSCQGQEKKFSESAEKTCVPALFRRYYTHE